MRFNRSDYWSVFLGSSGPLTNFDAILDTFTILPVLIIMSLCVSPLVFILENTVTKIGWLL